MNKNLNRSNTRKQRGGVREPSRSNAGIGVEEYSKLQVKDLY